MKPAGINLHSKTGKVKNFRQPETQEETSTLQNPSTSSQDSEAKQEFELELNWCIQALENFCKTSKLPPKNLDNINKTINIFKNPNQSNVKKRLLMNSILGDYRKKMSKEEKEMYPRNKRNQFQKKTIPKSHFVKKSVFQQTGKGFKFNFPEQKKEITTEDENSLPNVENNDETVKETVSSSSSFHFVPSDNSFKFDFSLAT